MGGDAKDGFGFGYPLADQAPRVCVNVVCESVQRIAVAEEYSGREPSHDR
jgi:hypothetical protein